jgi:hypothetical protein
MNPDMNVPPAAGPGVPPQPGAPMPGQPMPGQPMGMPMPGPAPQPMGMPAPAPEMMPQAMPSPDMSMPAPAPAPQPMFTPMTGPMPNQPMGGQPSFQPAFTPMAASQMSGGGSKKKLFIIIGIVIVLLGLGGGGFFLFSRTALVGSLSSDSYKGLNYKRPASWIKDTSSSTSVSYHPKQSVGKNASGDPTYALKMGVHAEEDIFEDTPDNMTASYKSALQAAIDDSIAKASSDILPSKSDVGCDESPVYKDKPKKIDVTNSFLAISYSFTCKATSGGTQTTFYFDVVDVVPNNKNIEYVVEMGAGSESVYNTNHSKITEILSSVGF